MTSTETAVSLMRMALALLKRDGNEEAALRLRRAIEAAGGVGPATDAAESESPGMRLREASC